LTSGKLEGVTESDLCRLLYANEAFTGASYNRGDVCSEDERSNVA